jgi:hypothetical protein
MAPKVGLPTAQTIRPLAEPLTGGGGKTSGSQRKSQSRAPDQGVLSGLAANSGKISRPASSHRRSNVSLPNRDAGKSAEAAADVGSNLLDAAGTASEIAQPLANSAGNKINTDAQIASMQSDAQDSMKLQMAGFRVNQMMQNTTMLVNIMEKGMDNAVSAAKGQ